MSHCSIFSPAALLTADSPALGAAGIIHSQTVDGETELLDAFSMASLELFSLCATCVNERSPSFGHRLLFFNDFFLESGADKLGRRHFWFLSGDDRGGCADQGGGGGGG